MHLHQLMLFYYCKNKMRRSKDICCLEEDVDKMRKLDLWGNMILENSKCLEELTTTKSSYKNKLIHDNMIAET